MTSKDRVRYFNNYCLINRLKYCKFNHLSVVDVLVLQVLFYLRHSHRQYPYHFGFGERFETDGGLNGEARVEEEVGQHQP